MPELPPPKLKPSQLRLIVALAKTGKLQFAAEMLGIAQPAASRLLADIETQAGTQLFVRHPKGMSITREGQTVAKKAQAILREMHDLDENLSNIKTGLAGKIRIGSVTGPAVKYIVPSVQALKDTSPEIDVTVEVAPSRQLLRQLLSGQLDLVLARILPEFSEAELSITPIGDEQVAMLVRQDHPLSNRKNLSLAEIVDHEWILQEMDSPIREAVIAALHMEKLSSPSNVLSSSSLLFALGYLSRSDAIAAVSSEVAQLLVESPVAASFVTLDIRKRFDIKPYFLIKLEAHVESPVERKLVEFIHATVAGDHLL